MVRIVGWTPTKRGTDSIPSFLNEFVHIFEAGEDGEHDYPMKRSGHRCFTDNDYFYLIGGYYTNERTEGRIFKELWAMSLATFEWRRYEVTGDFPESLASFAIVQIAPYSNTFLLFGGSGTAFGNSSSNSLYLVQVNNVYCTASSRKVDVEGEPPRPMYGHAMCAGEKPGKYYIVGGTEGNIFNFDVTSVTMKAVPDAQDGEKKYTWIYQRVSGNEGHPGRYRLEVNYDEVSNNLLFFGGGNVEEVFGFDKIITLDVKTHVTSDITTVPDQVNGFPKPRRCHTIVRYKRNVIISGGIATSENQEPPPQFSDVWIFNLDNYSWKKSEYSLPFSVFFHDTVITENGWMLSFGGVHGIQSDAPRNNMLTSAWFDVPTLQRFAMESLRSGYPKMFSGLYCGNFRPTNVLEVVTAFLRNGRIEEKEKQILEQQNIKFFEKSDRSRHYLNENGENYIVYTCLEHSGRRLADLESAKRQISHLDGIQWERRERDGIPVFIERDAPNYERVLEAMELLLMLRNTLGQCEVGSEIDEIKRIWLIVHDDINGREFLRQRFIREFQQNVEGEPEELDDIRNEGNQDGFRGAMRRVFGHFVGRQAGVLMMDRDGEESDSDESLNGENADNERPEGR